MRRTDTPFWKWLLLLIGGSLLFTFVYGFSSIPSVLGETYGMPLWLQAFMCVATSAFVLVMYALWWKWTEKRRAADLPMRRLAADTGAAVVPMCTLRNDDGSYTFAIDPELPRIEAPDGSYDILANTKKQNDALSQMVFDHPDQWVWFHKRWETTPESLARFLEAKRQAKERAARPREARSRVKK